MLTETIYLKWTNQQQEMSYVEVNSNGKKKYRALVTQFYIQYIHEHIDCIDKYF